jgi:hypothetical protein
VDDTIKRVTGLFLHIGIPKRKNERSSDSLKGERCYLVFVIS